MCPRTEPPASETRYTHLMLLSTAASASVVRLPWDSGGVADSHALRATRAWLPDMMARRAPPETAAAGVLSAYCGVPWGSGVA